MYMSMPVKKYSIPLESRQLISGRYRTITRAVNRSLWNSDSDSSHSFYVGSYGRGTAINTSDIDILIEVPDKFYVNTSYTTYNPQSRLLQVVKNAILERYPRSKVRGDGQVVVIDFSDGIKFEILPAIKSVSWLCGEIYNYPDTHMGGRWLSTNPKAEQNAMDEKDKQSNGLLKDTCKHIRYIRDNFFSSYHLSGIVIDSFVFSAIGNWHYPNDGGQRYGFGEKYEESLLSFYSQKFCYGQIADNLYAPGSNNYVDTIDSISCLGKVLRKMV